MIPIGCETHEWVDTFEYDMIPYELLEQIEGRFIDVKELDKEILEIEILVGDKYERFQPNYRIIPIGHESIENDYPMLKYPPINRKVGNVVKYTKKLATIVFE